MWRVVCVGPGPMDRVRRVCDRGPLLTEKARAESVASFLRATGLYESVWVEGASVKLALAAGPAPAGEMGNVPGASKDKSLDELSSMIDG